jgi:hypothetical protein
LVVAALENFHGQIRSLAEADNSRHILCPSAARAFMPASVEERLKTRSLLNVKCTHPLRSVHFVARDRKRVAADTIDFDGNFCRSLYSVNMEEHAGLCGNLSNFFDWLQHSDFIVGQHDGNQPGIRPQGTAHFVRINQAPAVHGNVSDFSANILKMFTGVKYGVMLYLRGNDVIPDGAKPCNCQVIAFSAAAGKDDLLLATT